MRLTALLLALLSPAAWAAEESAMNAADVSWMMVATTLVLFMTIPGIALFYAGMVRKKKRFIRRDAELCNLLLDYDCLVCLRLLSRFYRRQLLYRRF